VTDGVREVLSVQLKTVFRKLIGYCEANGWAGHDPYDALNSRVLEGIALFDSRIPRIAFTQLLKRSPINLRPALGIAKTENPKGLCLFLSALTKAADAGITAYESQRAHLVGRLEALRSTDQRYWCWGYNFPWQTRTVLVPLGVPNLVCTVFVAGALLDAYERDANSKCLEMATSAAEYIVDKLYWSGSGSAAGFGYPLPTVRNQVHNANLLAAALLCRVSRYTGERKFLARALKVARYSVSRQNGNGSWYYGEAESQRFVDNVHTGFNLCALQTIRRECQSDEFEQNVRRGYHYYRKHFYLENGSVRYFNNKTYPIDIHAVAQSIITPVMLNDTSQSSVDLAASVFCWALRHMWDPRGYFYYRVLRSNTIRIPYMRWSEAWMAVAIVQLLCSLVHQPVSPSELLHK